MGNDGVYDRVFHLLCVFSAGGCGRVLDFRQPVLDSGDVSGKLDL